MNRNFFADISKPHRFAVLDVTITGAGPRWLDSDCHQRAGFVGRRGRRRQSLLECRRIVDDVVGRQHHHCRRMISRRDPSRPECDRCRCVALLGFRHDVFLRQLRQQFSHGRFLVDVRQNK